MNDYIMVKMWKPLAVDMLVDRVRFWTNDNDVIDLYETYYTEMMDEGCFEGAEFDVKCIVDNDYINWLSYGTPEELQEQFGETPEKLEERIVARTSELVLVHNQ